MDMYLEFLRLCGRTYDYKILYCSILKTILSAQGRPTRVLLIVGDIANACVTCPHSCSRSLV